jgi:tRNA nucleotidyltransferase/poly(A) polymerase
MPKKVEKPKDTVTLFNEKSEEYKNGDLPLTDFKKLMVELKHDWQIKDQKNKEGFVTYNAHINNLRNTVTSQLKKEYLKPRVKLVSQRSKIDHMQIAISSYQQRGNSLILKDNEPTQEDI